jgi:hypothetical protein
LADRGVADGNHLNNNRDIIKPLAIDLYCGLGGWTEALFAEGWDVVGFDIERHEYGEHRYPGQLVIQDVVTLHGSQFKDVALIVASPPCQAYSYRAMPWKRAKALPPPDNTLFEVCFRIQREACEVAGRHIPLIVENVRGAQKWVGRARWNYGSFYLWGDVPALMPRAIAAHKHDNSGWRDNGTLLSCNRMVPDRFDDSGRKSSGMNWSDRSKRGQDFTRVAGNQAGVKNGNDWFGSGADCSLQRAQGSKSPARKFASAMIAKIPYPLARHIAAVYWPR